MKPRITMARHPPLTTCENVNVPASPRIAYDSLALGRLVARHARYRPSHLAVVAPSGMRRVGELRAMAADYAKMASEMEAQQPYLRKWVGL